VTWTWVRGHGASAEQNRCDQLAHAAARSLAAAA
jgi:ribonuclease HI